MFNVCWCEGSTDAWGIIVFVRTGGMVHAALVPAFRDANGAERFDQFMASSENTLETGLAKLEDDHWEVSSQRTTLKWPPGALS